MPRARIRWKRFAWNRIGSLGSKERWQYRVLRSFHIQTTGRGASGSLGPRTHIHVRQRGSWAEQFALLFRDYMRNHADEATKYAAVKRVLAEQYATDQAAYTDAKEPYLWELMHRADRWSQDVGWRIGPSDA